MGITQQIGASSLIKPGVIDNTATRPASPYEGQVIFQKDTDQLLVWNGTAWVIPNSPAQNPMGLEYITGGTLSLTPIDGIFTSTYDNYRIIVNQVSQSGTSNLLCYQYRTTANATESGANYSGSTLRYDTGTAYNFSESNVTFIQTGVNPLSGDTWGNLVMDIFQPRLNTKTMMNAYGNGFISNYSLVTHGSVFNTAREFAGIRFYTGNGTLNGGTYQVYGYRK
jgi:hypothetical protein